MFQLINTRGRANDFRTNLRKWIFVVIIIVPKLLRAIQYNTLISPDKNCVPMTCPKDVCSTVAFEPSVRLLKKSIIGIP